MRATLGQCAEWSGAELVGDADTQIMGVLADSRLCTPGALFVGIAGPNFDGNEFVAEAVDKGAVAALVRDRSALRGLPGLVVEDTIGALGRLAHGYRMNTSIPWIGITGSCGKTTTREMLGCILRERGPVAISARNYNNNIGVPLSILSVPDDAWAGVIELGTNAPGEIGHLARILHPNAGIVTMAGSAHLEGFGSVEAVAHEKASLFGELAEDGLAVYPAGEAIEQFALSHIRTASRTFAIENQADIVAEDIVLENGGMRFRAWETDFSIPVIGRHNVRNALAAVVVADWLGITPDCAAARLGGFKGVAGRLDPRPTGRVRIIDDTYNANPDSLLAAVETLVLLEARRRVLVVGAMAELGAESDRIHRECGQKIAQSGVDTIVAVGRDTVGFSEAAAHSSARCKVYYFPTHIAANTRLGEILKPDDLILVKGSRAARMEKVVGKIESLFRESKRISKRTRNNA